MTADIYSKLARELATIQNSQNLTKNQQKIISPGGKEIILKPFAKMHGFDETNLEKTVKTSSFFELRSVKVKSGFLIKKETQMNAIRFTSDNKLINKYNNNPDKVMTEAIRSRFLREKIMNIINSNQAKILVKRITEATRFTYNRPLPNTESLYKKYFPDELEKYEQEGKSVSAMEKKFLKKVHKGSEFYFSDGKVANSLLSWVQCIQLAPPQVVSTHLMNTDFEIWLRDEVKVRELANICAALAKRFETESLNPWEVKTKFINRLNRTSIEGMIYEHTIKPVVKNLRSNDPSRAQEAAEKLMRIGDERAVEPLAGKLFDSVPKTREIVIKALGKFGDKRATPSLLKILEYSQDKDDKLNTIKALGFIQDRRAKKVLKKLAKNQDEIGKEARIVLENHF
jgi:DNA-directed RNA polymerase subunit F